MFKQKRNDHVVNIEDDGAKGIGKEPVFESRIIDSSNFFCQQWLNTINFPLGFKHEWFKFDANTIYIHILMLVLFLILTLLYIYNFYF